MLNENAKKWVAALRSGEFKQGKNELENNLSVEHCCLGVACRVAEQNGISLVIDKTNLHGKTRFDGNGQLLPSSVRAWLCLASPNGKFTVASSNIQSLTRLNDRGVSFSEIADLIESEPEGLFL